MKKRLIPIKKAVQNHMGTRGRIYPYCEPDNKWRESVNRHCGRLIKHWGFKETSEYNRREAEQGRER